MKDFWLIAFILTITSCTHLAIEDCGSQVLGVNEARIRSSHFRMLLEDRAAAANRFLPAAAMSTLAYVEDSDCGKETAKVTSQEREALERILQNERWMEVTEIEWIPACEDNVGLFYRVWKKELDDATQVVVAFRGTWELKDWFYGNLHWLTRFLPIEDQYSSARKNMQKVFDYFSESKKPVQFFTTGHSLGGGLAQHILYSNPTKIIQAVVFDPSSVTGFADQTPENQVSACECDSSALNGEARIYRVYDAYEILANLRIFHKLVFPPERHIQEVRFPNEASHSMKGLAFYLFDRANEKKSDQYVNPWYSGQGNHGATQSCTHAFASEQKKSCSIKVTADQWFKCPQ